MKVVCRVNNLNQISDENFRNRLKKYYRNSDGDVGVEIGRAYTLYGVVYWDNYPFYYLCPDDDDEYPIPFDSLFFDVSDARLSRNWRLSSSRREPDRRHVVVFEEWANDAMFYEHLVEGHSAEAKQFLKYKHLMDKEFRP